MCAVIGAAIEGVGEAGAGEEAVCVQAIAPNRNKPSKQMNRIMLTA